MPGTSPTRYATYRRLLDNPKHWQKALAIISCKLIREDSRFKEEFKKLLDTLLDPDFRRLVASNDWQLVFTGGTFDELPRRVREQPEYQGRLYGLAGSALGVIQVANLAVYGHLMAVFFYNHMEDLYADSPQNLCLRRICNCFDIPLLEDSSSISYVIREWSQGRHALPSHPGAYDQALIDRYYGQDEVLYAKELEGETPRERSRETLAVVSHDDRKMTMLNFCLRYMREILSYKRVISTGTTGKFLAEQMRVALSVPGGHTPADWMTDWGWDPGREPLDAFLARKIQPFESGPKGGDIQISAKVIDGTCHRVLFFQDPEKAHPHQFDIRLLEKAAQDPETAVLFATSAPAATMMV